MKRHALALLAAVLLASFTCRAEEFVTPPASLTLEGIPAIPAEIARKLKPYGEFRPHGLMSWHPLRREMLVRQRLDATNQVHLVTEPGTTPQPLTDFPNAVGSASFQPTRGDYFIFPIGEGGDEAFRLNRFDIATRTVTPLSPEGERADDVAWNRKGDRVVYTTVLVDRNNPGRTARTALHLVDPMKPRSDRVLARMGGGGWTGLGFSEDGRRLAMVEYVSVNQSHLWVLDIATGKMRRVTRPGKDEPVSYSEPHFARDGRTLFATSDRSGEFRRLVQIDLADGKERVLTAHLAYDVDQVAVSFDAERIAFTTNERGSHVLRFIDLRSLKEQPRPALIDGVIGGLAWRQGSNEVGFHIASARSAGDVFSYDVKANRFTRWTNGNNPEMNTNDFAEPRIVRWPSFDGREMTGLHYHPPKRFEGKRPVIVSIHGGPESQAKAGFIGRNNYFVGELGIAVIYPNVRGSTGFGKSFAKLDNGRRREDSVKDIGALLDWIRAQPDLDGDRVMVIGGSYGGYMALATSLRYADRIAGAVSVVGISNFVTFLERTESYRRDLRRAEYGDERDPLMREFLEVIAPVNNAERMKKPLLVAQGRNDPRVPRTEAHQIVATLKRQGTPAWFIEAADEGHGFAKKPNADYLFYAIIAFAERTLLK